MRWMALKLGAQPWLPRFARVIVGMDKLLQRLTRGRIDLLMVQRANFPNSDASEVRRAFEEAAAASGD